MKLKNYYLTLTILLVCSWNVLNAQSIRQLLRGDKGISNENIRLDENRRASFSLKKIDQTLGLDESSTMQLVREEKDVLGINYRFRQLLHGIPVENTMLIIQTNQNSIKTISGKIVVDVDPAISARRTAIITDSKSIEIALSQMKAIRYAWEDESMEQQMKLSSGIVVASNRPSTELVWYPSSDELDARDLHLAYKVIVYSLEPLSRNAYFIDASTGSVLGKKDMLYFTDATGSASTVYSSTQTIHSDLSGGSYRLRDLTKGNGVITLHGETSNHTDYTSTTSNWSFTTNDKYALDAHYGASQTYNFYQANFARNSINNAGYALTSYVNETATTNNAYWDGSIMHFGVRSGTNAGITAIDVTAHELTHGLTQYTSNLNYSNESGAINESMSDIFGKAVQFWSKPTDVNWLLSNDMNWAIRSMSNPKLYGQPNCYTGTNWYTGTSDNGGVHTNSGVGNFFYYLLVTGGTGTNDKSNAYTVNGIGLTSANAIIYRSETAYLTPTSNYASWRTACISAATDLFGASSNEVTQVQNAWYAVGVGTTGGGTGSTCTTPTSLASSSITNSGANLTWASTGASSYNLQYKPTVGTVWTTISSLTTNSYSLAGLSTCTSYQFQVQGVCAASSSAYSSAASFSTIGCTVSPYCSSAGTNSSYEYINKILIGTINNTSGNNNGYGDFTSMNTNLAGGSTASITLTPGFSRTAYREYWNVWIDYNHNGVFTDAGEKVITGNGTAAIVKTFVIPTTALNGTTRMRIQMTYNGAAATSCTTFTYGEVEDYTVTVTGNAAISNHPFVNTDFENINSLYPNPASDKIKLTISSQSEEEIEAGLYNNMGQWIKKFDFQLVVGKNEFEMNVNDLPEGLYILQVHGTNSAVHRFMIKK